MKFEQVKDLIDHAISFHDKLSNHFLGVSERTDNQRLKLLLDYLVEHERAQACRLAEYEIEAPIKILDTWFQFSNCEKKFNELQAALKHDESTVAEVVDLTVMLYDCIITQFGQFAQHVDVDEVKEAFLSIAALEKKEKMKIVRNSRMLEDL